MNLNKRVKQEDDFMTVKKRDHINKKIIICLLVFLSMFMLPVATTRASSNVIENNKSGIPDKNLYKTILKKLGKKTGQKFTKEEAERIKSLAVGSGRVKSLKGIKYLKNLEKLDVEGTGLNNLKGIQSLTKLKVLNVSRNYIKVSA